VSPAAQSSEWIMADDSIHYIQAGWLKKYGWTEPHHFAEYYCPTVCEFFYGSVPSNTTHVYKVELVPPNWCAYLDGASLQCVDTTTLGLADAIYADYSGETSDTKADLGGTPSNHFRLFNLQFKYLSDNIWYQINTNYMVNLLTPHTPYSDSIGFTSPYTWIENWTNR
jgi:hypothetical protein